MTRAGWTAGRSAFLRQPVVMDEKQQVIARLRYRARAMEQARLMAAAPELLSALRRYVKADSLGARDSTSLYTFGLLALYKAESKG